MRFFLHPSFFLCCAAALTSTAGEEKATPVLQARLMVPSSVEGEEPERLLVLLHGEGSDERAFAERFRGVAERARLAVLSLRGPRTGPAGGYDWFDPDTPSPRAALRAVYPALVEAVRKAARSLGVNPRAIVIAGYSRGAVAALYAGLDFPGLFGGGVIAFAGKGFRIEDAGKGGEAVARAASLGRRVVLTAGLREGAVEAESTARYLNDHGVACALFAFGTGRALPPHLDTVVERILAWLAE